MTSLYSLKWSHRQTDGQTGGEGCCAAGVSVVEHRGKINNDKYRPITLLNNSSDVKASRKQQERKKYTHTQQQQPWGLGSLYASDEHLQNAHTLFGKWAQIENPVDQPLMTLITRKFFFFFLLKWMWIGGLGFWESNIKALLQSLFKQVWESKENSRARLRGEDKSNVAVNTETEVERRMKRDKDEM